MSSCSDSGSPVSNFTSYSNAKSRAGPSNPKKSTFGKQDGNQTIEKEHQVEVAQKIIKDCENEELEQLIRNNKKVIEKSNALKFKVTCLDYIRLFLPGFLDNYSKRDVFIEVSKIYLIPVFLTSVGQRND